MKKLTNWTLKGVYLSFDEDGNNIIIRIPQGLIQKNQDIAFYRENNKIFAQLGGETSQVYPSPEWTISTNGMDFTVKLACTIKELNEGRKLLLEHYMGIPSRGLFINVYHESSKEVPIACGCLDRLYYAMPVGRKHILDAAGREDLINEAFAKKSDENAADKNARVPSAPNSTGKNEFGYKKGLRAKVVNELRIVWISRIAIVNNDSFRHKHLSVKIAKLMGRIAHECMLPHADFVEVFESFPKRDTQKFKEHNLYLYAGFKMSDEAIRSSKMVFLDYQDEGYINAGKLYLYKDLRDKE